MHCETLQWENPLCRFDLQRLLINVYVFTVHGCHSKDMTLVFKPFRVVETIKLNFCFTFQSFMLLEMIF